MTNFCPCEGECARVGPFWFTPYCPNGMEDIWPHGNSECKLAHGVLSTPCQDGPTKDEKSEKKT